MGKYQVPGLKPRNGGPVQTSTVNLLAMAKNYSVAAQCVLQSGNGLLAPPLYMLVSHSFEFSLKAYILDRTADVTVIERYGHNLSRCWAAALELGLSPCSEAGPSEFGELRAAVNALSEHHRGHTFRYMPDVQPFTVSIAPNTAVAAAGELCQLIAHEILMAEINGEP